MGLSRGNSCLPDQMLMAWRDVSSPPAFWTSTCHSFLWHLYWLCMWDLFFTCDQNVTGVSLGITAAEPGSCHLLSKKHLVAVFSYATTKHCRLLCLLLQMQVAFFGLLCSWRTLWQHCTKILLFKLSYAMGISFPWSEEQSLDQRWQMLCSKQGDLPQCSWHQWSWEINFCGV